MKKVLITLLVLSFCTLASAQGFKIGAAGNAAFPTGDWSEFTSSTAWGVEGFAVVDVMLLTLTARVGYMNFGENEYSEAGQTIKTTITSVPILAGLRWEFGIPVGPSFFAGVEAGVSMLTTTVEAEGFTVPNPEETESKFTLSPNVGVTLMGFELAAYYNIISDANYWGVRLGWGIGI